MSEHCENDQEIPLTGEKDQFIMSLTYLFAIKLKKFPDNHSKLCKPHVIKYARVN